MSGLGGINEKGASDLMELDKPTAAARASLLLGRARRLYPRNEGGSRGPKLSQSLLEHVFVLPGTGPSQGRTIGGQPTSEEKTQKSTRSNRQGNWAYRVDTN
jgi:hypothetical protein